MGKTSAEVKNRYAKKTYDKFTCCFKKGKAEEYKKIAENKGLSLTAYIVNLIEKDNKTE